MPVLRDENDNEYVYSPANNIEKITLYALALAAALGLNDFVRAIFDKYDISNNNIIVSKFIYVAFIITLAILFAYFTKRTVSI